MNGSSMTPFSIESLDEIMDEFDRYQPHIDAARNGGCMRTGPVGAEAQATVSLVRDDYGVLHWQMGDAPPQAGRIGGRREALPDIEGEIVWQREVKNLGRNGVIEKLQHLDLQLLTHGLSLDDPNEPAGAGTLHELNKEDLRMQKVDNVTEQENERLLVLIHGTFSRTSALVDEIQKAPNCGEFWSWAKQNYTRILGFDHPTLSVSPILNAFALERSLSQSKAEVDIICHSRGGLVGRWWLEMLDTAKRRRRRAVLVGCPLTGTSLAAPDRLKRALDHLSNTIEAVGGIASRDLFKIALVGLASIGAWALKVPGDLGAFDALFGMIPGLAAMSRIQNNSELNELMKSKGQGVVEYFGVRSNFQPPEIRAWRFWNVFNRPDPDRRLLNTLADNFVFRDEHDDPLDNDLVVDCDAMDLPGNPIPPQNWLRFGQVSDKVHHTNYFQQPEMLDFVKNRLTP